MRQVPKLNIFTVIMSAEFSANMLTPLLTFIFFAMDSPLFSTPVSMAQRGLLFGLCLGLYKFGEVLSNTLITTLSDHFGRKMALYGTLLGLLTVAMAGIGALYWHSPALMIGGLFVCNLLNTNKAIAAAIMSDISVSQNRVTHMAMAQCVIALGACLGPVVGGQLANQPFFLQTAYALPFIVTGLIAVFGLLVLRDCPETLTVHRKTTKISLKTLFGDYKLLWQNKTIHRPFWLLILCQISWSSYYEFMPPMLKNIFHYTPSQVGLFVGLIAFWLIFAASFVIRCLLRIYRYRQLTWFSAIALAAGALSAVMALENPTLIWSHYLLWFSAIPIAMGDVIFFSLFTAFLSHQVSANQQGSAMGLVLVVAMLVWSATALLGGYLLTLHPHGALFLAPLGAFGLLMALIRSPQSFDPQEASCDTVS